MTDRLYLIRHGETAWSQAGRHTGRTDLELTAQGEQDASRLGKRLAGLQYDQVFTSPLKRASRTCELAGLAGKATVLQALLEWDYGDYEGKTSAEIRAQRADWDLFRDGCPGGEAMADVVGRVERALGVFREQQGPILVFSSGHLLRVLAARWLGCQGEFARYLALDPASLSLLGYEHGQRDPVLRFWNDARCSQTIYGPASLIRTRMTTPKLKANVKERTPLHEGFLRVYRYIFQVEKHAGGTDLIKRELMERGDAVAVLGFDPEREEVVLCNEFRPGLLVAGEYPYRDNLVPGAIDAGETALQAAVREMHEETGLELRQPQLIHPGAFVSSGGTSERIALVFGLVDASQAGGVHGDAAQHEDILTVVLPTATFLTRVRAGQINDLKTLVAGYWFAERQTTGEPN